MRFAGQARCFATLAGTAFLITSCLAQGPSLKPRGAQESRITLPVLCHSEPKAECDALSAADLRVQVDRHAVATADLSVSHTPAGVVLVLDALNTPLPDALRSRDAVMAWLRSAGPLPAETSVLLVADTRPRFRGSQPDNVAGWELIKDELYIARIAPGRDGLALADALAKWEPSLPRIREAQAEAGGSERVRDSLQSLSFIAAALKTDAAPKLLVWISPGWPLTHMTRDGLSAQVFDSIVYFYSALRDSGIVLDAIDPTGAATEHDATGEAPQTGDRSDGLRKAMLSRPDGHAGATAYQAFMKPAHSPRDADPNDMLLGVLAEHTGGTVQVNSNDIRGALARFAEDAARLCTVSFPAAAASGKETLHAVSINSVDGHHVLRSAEIFYAR